MDSEDDEINTLMASAQSHDEKDEVKRARSSVFSPVKVPVSRALFPMAKRTGAKVIFTTSTDKNLNKK